MQNALQYSKHTVLVMYSKHHITQRLRETVRAVTRQQTPNMYYQQPKLKAQRTVQHRTHLWLTAKVWYFCTSANTGESCVLCL